MLAVFRNAIARSRIRAISSSARRTDDEFTDMANLANSMATEAPSTFVPTANSAFRSFEPYQFISPSRLTYDSVVKRKAFPTKMPAVGPSRKDARKRDLFHLQNVDPLDQALNPAITSRFLTEMGKVMGRNVTGLTKKSQRRYGKAVRRAKMMGVIPILSKRNIRGAYRDPIKYAFQKDF
ncbi:hypothetical protein VKT23_001912 [Stygiomarasmius scandens]|uniref:Small ribosomal subunit protein bS18m n=1 Tax=Marasmiellus scandens TaxID=2682957 RepID=A0ABR1K0C7_9AGAR